jgi:imidazolonepropionase-like amidohydrolase
MPNATSSSYLFVGASVFDGTGTDPAPLDVLTTGNRIVKVGPRGQLVARGATVVDGTGATLIPGLVEAHTHLGFGSSIERPEPAWGLSNNAMLLRATLAGRVLLDAGFTSGYSGGNNIPEHDVLLRAEFEGGYFPGPRLRAASWEGAETSLAPDHQRTAPDPVAAAKFVYEMADLGVDILKVTLSGESGLRPYSSRELVFTDEEVAAIAAAARERHLWLSAHAHAAEAVKRAVRHGFRVVYHATWTDEEGMDLLEAAKDRIFVAPGPGINWANVNEPSAPPATEQAETIEQVKVVMPELKRRGVRVLPGGDYGFFWNLIGKNARDLELFVDWFGFTPAEALTAATKWGGELMDLEVGLVQEGYLADLVLVEGDPLQDIRVIADRDRLKVIMKDGRLHKADRDRTAARTEAA